MPHLIIDNGMTRFSPIGQRLSENCSGGNSTVTLQSCLQSLAASPCQVDDPCTSLHHRIFHNKKHSYKFNIHTKNNQALFLDKMKSEEYRLLSSLLLLIIQFMEMSQFAFQGPHNFPADLFTNKS